MEDRPAASPWTSARSWLVAAAALCLSLVYSYRDVIERLVHQWTTNDDYSHGLLIPPLALYLAWMKRTELRGTPLETDWRGIVLLVAAVGIYTVGEVGADVNLPRVSLLLSLIGAIWLLCGWRVVKVLRFPLAFLFLMLPLPGFVYSRLTFHLQLISSKLSVDLLQVLGLSVFREGNIIDLSGMRLQVVEACNGLRYILPLLTLAVLIAFLGHGTWWKRAVLILSAIPMAIASNVLRIAGTGVVAERWGRELADGFLHDFSGWLVFMVSLGFFFAMHNLLKRIPGASREEPDPSPTPPPHAGSGARPMPWRPLLAALISILAVQPVVATLGQVDPVKLHKPLAEFPSQMDGWVGTPTTMDAEMWKRVGGQDYVLINYSKPQEPPVNFYVAYYEFQKKAGDFVHSPRLCLPGAGWFIDSSDERVITDPGRGAGSLAAPRPLRLNELIISKDGVRQLTYFWYQGRGRNFTSEYAAKFYMVWDGLLRRRTDGALVRLVMALDSRSDVQEERRTLDRFALEVARKLDEHLP